MAISLCSDVVCTFLTFTVPSLSPTNSTYEGDYLSQDLQDVAWVAFISFLPRAFSYSLVNELGMVLYMAGYSSIADACSRLHKIFAGIAKR